MCLGLHDGLQASQEDKTSGQMHLLRLTMGYFISRCSKKALPGPSFRPFDFSASRTRIHVGFYSL